jgi:hypothetical protein
MKMPTVKEVTQELVAQKRWCRGQWDDFGGYVDVRLQVMEDGGWAIRTGDSSYDQDHRGYWGASSIDPHTNCRDLAIELLDQCAEHAACSGPAD